MNPETFIELRCIIAAFREKGVSNDEIETLLKQNGADSENINDLMYRWQS